MREIEIEAKEPSPELGKKILLRIEGIEHRRLILKTIGFGAVLMASISLVVYGCFAVAADAAHSGFFAFASLFFSDFSATVASFSDYALSIIESFPVFSMTILLSGVFCGVWSAAGFVNELSIINKGTFSTSS